jgi:hypothetical protein
MELLRATKQQADHGPSPRSSPVATSVSIHPILRLQRMVGNQAVQRLLKSRALQAKLAVSQPGDIYEQEADRVADLVISQALGPVQRKCACGSSSSEECDGCRNNREEPLVPSTSVQRHDEGEYKISEAPPVVDQVLGSPGFPLDESTRSFMESRFEHDFSNVRVHSDAQAAASARAVDALAYTVGPHMVFGSGQYAPSTSTGRKLLAHELTHVIQQSASVTRKPVSLDVIFGDPPDSSDHATAEKKLEFGKGGAISTPALQRRVVCDPEDPEACWEEPEESTETPAQEPLETPVSGPPAPEESVETPIYGPPAPEEPVETPAEEEAPIYGPPAPEESAETPAGEEAPIYGPTAAEEPEETSAEQTPTEDQGPAETQNEESGKVTIPLKQNLIHVSSHPVDAGIATLKFAIAVEVAGEIEVSSKSESESGESQETSVVPLGYDTGEIVIAIGRAWHDKNGVSIIGWDTAFTEVKLEGGVKIDKGFKVDLEGSGKLACGVEVKLELNLIKIEENWEVKGPGVTLGVELPWFPFDVDLGPTVKLKDVQVHPVVEVEVEPNYKRILGELAKDVGEEALGEQAVEKAGEAGTALLGADALIIGGILLAGAGSIGAAILTIKEGDEIAETHGQCVALATKLTEGFRIGVVGGSTPGEKELMPGYTQGIRNFNSAHSKLKQQNPDADDATITAAIAAQADAVTAQAQSQIMDMAKDTVWNKYASGHQDTWYHSYDFDRWAAWSNIYGDDPRGDKRYTRYCPDHKCSHGM